MGHDELLFAKGLVIGNNGIALTRDINFSITSGECILLCGANGIGKSTFLRTIAGLIPSISGSFGPLKTNIMIVPARIPKVKGFTTVEFIATSCYRDSNWLGRLKAKDKANILNAMRDIGIENLYERDIESLSDGEFQKAAIASAIVQRTDIILLDEPTAFLDVDSRENVMSVIHDMVSTHKISVIFSSHDISSALHHCNRVFGLTNNHLEGDSNEGLIHFLDSGPNATDETKKLILSKCFHAFRTSFEMIE